MLPASRFPVAVCGLAAEARVAREAGFETIVVGAGDAARLAAGIGAALASASCLVSFGIAGGLDPALEAGNLILSGDIIGEPGRWIVPEAFGHRLAALAPTLGATHGAVLGSTRILATVAEKAGARARTGAATVDLESAVVAASANAAALPFLALRAIVDAAADALPAAALVPLRRDGTPRLRLVAACVLRRPGELAGLVRLARQTRIALGALRGAAPMLYRLVAAL